jgi:quercetin dioxygenase-like cupin family protein
MPTKCDEVDAFLERGYLGPVSVLTDLQCKQLWKATRSARRKRHPVWKKSLAVISRPLYELAIHPRIVDIVTHVLGDDFMLWGACFESRRKDAVHAWHSDIETAVLPQKTVSVWVGIMNVERESSPMIVPYSHRFGITVQEERLRRGMDRNEVSSSDIEAWAKERNKLSRPFTTALSNGSALFFDGRLWHGSHNTSERHRHAVLLQYANPDAEIRLPDLSMLDWPFTFFDQPKPPCIMIRGTSRNKSNQFVRPPSASSDGSEKSLLSQAHRIDLPLACRRKSGWTPYPLFSGSTGNHGSISCHVSSLRPGVIPHPPHQHEQEELLVMLDGEADLLLPELDVMSQSDRVRLRRGQFVYYPANFPHTLTAVGNSPANYLMFKWFTKHVAHRASLRFGLFDILEKGSVTHIANQLSVRQLFEGPTLCLKKLHAHTSTLPPGASYQPHIDAHDIAILVISGQIRTNGDNYHANSLIYFPAGESHDMSNVGDETSRYLVFEFHGHNGSLAAIYRSRFKSISKKLLRTLKRLLSPRRWRHRFLSTFGL